MRRLFYAAALAIVAIASGAGQAQEFKVGDLLIDHPWARASIGQAKAGAAYLVVSNRGTEADRITAADTPVAKRAEFHTHIMEGGVMKMRPVGAVEVAPGEPVVFQPGGLHVMLMGLKAPLKEGETFPLTLKFENAGQVEIQVKIGAPTATEPVLPQTSWEEAEAWLHKELQDKHL